MKFHQISSNNKSLICNKFGPNKKDNKKNKMETKLEVDQHKLGSSDGYIRSVGSVFMGSIHWCVLLCMTLTFFESLIRSTA